MQHIHLLPFEILFDIFEQLIFYSSYKYVTRLKIVCKLWNGIIKSAINSTVNEKLKKYLQLEMVCSNYPIVTVKFFKDLKFYIGLYNNNPNLQNLQSKYFFKLATNDNTPNEIPEYVRIGFIPKNCSQRTNNMNNIQYTIPATHMANEYNNYLNVEMTKLVKHECSFKKYCNFGKISWRCDDEMAIAWEEEKKNNYNIRKLRYIVISLKRERTSLREEIVSLKSMITKLHEENQLNRGAVLAFEAPEVLRDDLTWSYMVSKFNTLQDGPWLVPDENINWEFDHINFENFEYAIEEGSNRIVILRPHPLWGVCVCCNDECELSYHPDVGITQFCETCFRDFNKFMSVSGGENNESENDSEEFYNDEINFQIFSYRNETRPIPRLDENN